MNAAAPIDRDARLDVQRLRQDFPILEQRIHGRPLVYLDNAATTQKPRAVLDAERNYYETMNANVHRGVHTLSERSTAAHEGARERVRQFLNARSSREIVFTRGTTEAINLVAASFGQRLKSGDEVLITWMEHHSNIVPWQLACERSGAQLKVAPIDDRGDLIMEEFERLLSPRTRIVAVVHVSNALGTINPVEAIIGLARARGVPVLLDGAQAVAHMAVDVRRLDCDFYAFSGHKLYAPTGIGVLYGREALLETMPPWQGGGDMIKAVSFDKTVYNDLPYKFEAGTPNMAGAVGLHAALDYVGAVGLGCMAEHEHELLAYATGRLAAVPGLRIVGTATRKAAVLSFVLDDIHPHDLGTILDHEGVAVRTGHHCAMPVMTRYGLPATARASFACYNTAAEVDALVAAIGKARAVFRR